MWCCRKSAPAVAAEIAERMRLAVQEGKEAKFTSTLRITASFGVAALSEQLNDHNAMLEQADKALYAAKEGRTQSSHQMEQRAGRSGRPRRCLRQRTPRPRQPNPRPMPRRRPRRKRRARWWRFHNWFQRKAGSQRPR